MAEAVIFPDEPLFMVDRGWQRRKKKANRHTVPREQDLNLQPSRAPEISITIAVGSIDSRSRSPPEGKDDKRTPKSSPERRGQIEFMSYEPQKGSRKQATASKELHQNRKSAFHKSTCLDPEEVHENLFVLKQALPGTAIALYPAIDPEVSSFQSFVNYCKFFHDRLSLESSLH